MPGEAPSWVVLDDPEILLIARQEVAQSIFDSCHERRRYGVMKWNERLVIEILLDYGLGIRSSYGH